MRPMLMRELKDPAPARGLIIGVDFGQGVRVMAELLEPYQEQRFSDEVGWTAKVYRGSREIGPKYNGAIIKVSPRQRILLPGKQP